MGRKPTEPPQKWDLFELEDHVKFDEGYSEVNGVKVGPIPNKVYRLQQSKWITVKGFRFLFARPAIVQSKAKVDESGAVTRPPQAWLAFSMYWESPSISVEGESPVTVSQIIRSCRVYKGRIQATIAPFYPGKFYTIWYVNPTFARIIYEAIKQWDLIADNPELTVDGVKNPLGTISYSKATAFHSLTPVGQNRTWGLYGTRRPRKAREWRDEFRAGEDMAWAEEERKKRFPGAPKKKRAAEQIEIAMEGEVGLELGGE